MKKLIFVLLLIPAITHAQLPIMKKKASKKYLYNNIKTNIWGLAVKNYNLTYERRVGRKISVSLGARYMPYATIPFTNVVGKYLNDPSIPLDRFKLGNQAVTTEMRWYPGKRALRGFYIAPYFRYSQFDASVPVKVTDGNNFSRNVDMSGKITSYNGGLMFGVQYNLSKRIVLDLTLVGVHYGIANGSLAGNNLGLSPDEQIDLKSRLDDLRTIGLITTTNEVTSNSAIIKANGPWAGARVLTLSLGYSF